nr:excitatory amino acid transporter 2, isoform D [Drosophila melanogaster]NP_477427.1 excitatory amino acid transporter 2, isoform A [Drosophila melanogaster]AAF51466.1 excitatory amino acid transporter 2, isoform A [Drosophila melanogaster]ACZ94137.1 excitatory amino acid transporter 2, isoform D [Drosophila melanogaster]|eukprot:NP_001162845.1 excitatory amino acid transporter 2, isoform D [Drosophila melanogaster]
MGPPTSTELPPKTTECSDAPVELTGYRRWLSENLMLLVTLSGVLLGVILGLSLRPLNLHGDSIMLISYPGELFMRVLKLMILPLVISSLIAGSASLNAKMNGKIALRTLVYFASTSFFNAALGIALVLLIHPGNPDLHNADDRSTDRRAVNLLDSLLDLGRNVFPDNLFQASIQQAHTVYLPKPSILHVFNETMNDTLASGSEAQRLSEDLTEDVVLVRDIQYRSGTNTLGIVFFCLVFGTFLGTIGQKGQVVVDFFAAIFEVIMKMVTCVMWLTPVGISSVIAGKILSVGDLGLVMSQLMWFIVTVAIGVFIYQFVVMQAIYFVVVRRNPFKFYAGLIQAMLTAFATASTAAALPITFRCMNEKLKVDPRITRFVLPIGCNINMDGTALYIAVASIFIAQMSGMVLGFGELLTVLLTSTAASMSSASVPSAALVLLLVVLTAIDAPVQDVTLLFAVDWFVDRIRTTNNMLGDCYTAAVVEELSRKELMALDAASVNYQDMPAGTPNGHGHGHGHHDGGLLEGQTELETSSKCVMTMTDSVVVDISAVMNNVNLQQEHCNRRV